MGNGRGWQHRHFAEDPFALWGQGPIPPNKLATVGAAAHGHAGQKQTSTEVFARKESHWPLRMLGTEADGTWRLEQAAKINAIEVAAPIPFGVPTSVIGKTHRWDGIFFAEKKEAGGQDDGLGASKKLFAGGPTKTGGSREENGFGRKWNRISRWMTFSEKNDVRNPGSRGEQEESWGMFILRFLRCRYGLVWVARFLMVGCHMPGMFRTTTALWNRPMPPTVLAIASNPWLGPKICHKGWLDLT